MNERLDVCCAADLCADLILTGDVVPRFHQEEQLVDDYTLELGGSATIFASQFVKLGGRAGLVGAVGEDAFGTMILENAGRLGIDLRMVRRDAAIKTGLGVALVRPDGDRAILTYLGSIDAVAPSDLSDELLSACRHWHIASYFLLKQLRGFWRGWLEQCRAAGVTTSIDTNWDPEDRWEGVRELLPLIDVFLPNEAEARAISGEADLWKAGQRLSSSGPLVAIKRGSEGAIAFQGDQSWAGGGNADTRHPIPNAQIADTVGAGDNFDAGFLRARLLGWKIERCLELGCRCAGASLTAAGGIQGQLQEVVHGSG